MAAAAPARTVERLSCLDPRLDRVRTARDGEVAVEQRLATRLADGERMELRAADVAEDDRLGARVDVAVAPFLERVEHEVKLVAGLGDEVLVTRRTLGVLASFDDAAGFELAQPRGQDVARCSGR